MSAALSAIGSFDVSETVTVQKTYKWDDGIPLDTIMYYDLLINDPPVGSTNSSGKLYIGTAPFMSVTLSSTYTPHPSAVAVKRTYDFGDYYNTEHNVIVSTCFNDELVCHTYIMPGTYTIKMTVEEYRRVPKTIIPVGQYVQPGTVVGYPIDIYWQWRNFLCSDPENPLNRKLTWNYTGDCFCCYVWRDAVPCLCIDNCVWETTCPVVDNSVCINPGPTCEEITWNSLECSQE